MTKITYTQAWIESSVPDELDKCNETPKKIVYLVSFCTLVCNIDKPVKSFKVNFKRWLEAHQFFHDITHVPDIHHMNIKPCIAENTYATA